MTSGVADTAGSGRPSAAGELAWHTLSAEEVLRSEGADGQRGLSSAEAASRARRFWPQQVRECAELGIKHVWMHRGPGAGSVSAVATDYGRQRGITVIDGGCPLMFNPTADFGHKMMRLMFAGNVPKQV